ncbi:hypothetical protein BVC80_1827g68 [Macleaya cordata]|uniref:Uncharacterized protein n=1 Tax=Macleaya cordata TaxID=56857 RepID=A0A200QB65_MACCD|nr:hypothetical protein BVC80_1827g68 [Macleaya cordata]
MDEESDELQLQSLEPSILHNPHHHHHHLQQQNQLDQQDQHEDQEPFSLPSISEIVVFRDEDDEDEDEDNEKQVESPSPSSSDIDDSHNRRAAVKSTPIIPSNLRTPAYINPEPHISTQFYTFNGESHALMVLCILERRLATPDEIRRATPRPVLKSWRSVWKDRNEDTAYLTAWKRIQDKLNAHIDANGNQVLYFKNNSQQYVSHFDQWQDIVMSYHRDGDLKHLGLKETIDRIKQVWTVGAKFYGIPESFIRVCVSSCPFCSGPSGSATKSKRRRFEYTESFEVPAKEVPHRLQELAQKHKVVLCIRQKYIRYKPFMAEVKDYACHRAGEPAVKRSKILKREPYASKRCGCGFRIRAIVPITNYNEKDKTFVYQEEGMAVFKLYAVHTGHEPGPLDGNARIIHRVVGHKGGFSMDQETVYGMSEDMETDAYNLLGKDDCDLQLSVMHQVQELKVEVGLLEGKIMKIPKELLASLSRELLDVVNRLRSIGEEDVSRPVELVHDKQQQSEDVLVGESDLAHWGDHDHDQIYGDGKDTELIEEDEDSFERTLGDVVPWDRMRTECRSRKSLLSENCKSDKWLKDACGEFDEKGILDCEDSKLIKPLRHDGAIVTDAGLVGIQVESFYPENSKWYDSPCSLDPGADCGDSGFRPGEIV